jgi:hypothetical protein
VSLVRPSTPFPKGKREKGTKGGQGSGVVRPLRRSTLRFFYSYFLFLLIEKEKSYYKKKNKRKNKRRLDTIFIIFPADCPLVHL